MNDVQDVLSNHLTSDHHLHLVGVGGAGMRGLATLLEGESCRVTGCDQNADRVREISGQLRSELYSGHDATHVTGNQEGAPDLLIHSAALPEDHPERVAAREKDIPQVRYSDALAMLFNQKQGIAVAGTHGKTTCSAMLSIVLSAAELDPTCLVGGELKQWKGNARTGEGAHFVAEACEYGRNFFHMKPHHVLLTNIDRDHLDFYDSEAEIQEAFSRFVGNMEATGFLVAPEEGSYLEPVLAEAAGKVQTVSTESESDWWVKQVDPAGGKSRITLQSRGDTSPELPVPVPGDHQAMNTALVSVMARLLGATWEQIQTGLASYEGVKRRFDVLREDGPVLIDDYGHHPEELRCTLETARKAYPDRMLVACFQPHQFSRTYHFRDAWGAALEEADEVWLVPIYEARDGPEDRQRISIEDVAERMESENGSVRILETPRKAGEEMIRRDNKNRVYLTLGAGDIWKAADVFLKEQTTNS